MLLENNVNIRISRNVFWDSENLYLTDSNAPVNLQLENVIKVAQYVFHTC
jgi:hypothetical protein